MRRQKNNDNTKLFERFNRKPLRPNTIAPDFFVNPMWFHNDEPSGVEIIELNSSNEKETPPKQSNHDNASHAWSYVNKDEMEQIENSYKINKKARERRRLQKENHTLPSNDTSAEANELKDGFTNNLFRNHSNNDDTFPFDHQMNCFTILNKQLVESDTSTEAEYGEIEIMTTNDIIIGNGNWNQRDDFYNEEIITYDTDLDQETRTIWIYSFKNKHLLSGEDFETTNSTVRESSSTSYSTDSSGEQPNAKEHVGSSAATPYIPKLDLSLVPTLSTVMEISEPNMHPTADDTMNSADKLTKSNNWFVENAKETGRSVRRHEKSTNIINWMALSPRERRRVVKDKTLSDIWVGSRLNLTDSLCKQEDHGDVMTNETIRQNNTVKVQVDVDVHVDHGDEVKKEMKSIAKTKLESAKSVDKSNNDNDEICSINKLKFTDAENEVFQKDQGNHNVKLGAPVICLNAHICKSDITNPIENIENNDWICNKKEKETCVYDYVLERSESILDDKNGTNVDHLWLKGTVPFLKPSQWTEFKPIADSPTSYNNFSIGSIEERENWFSRFMNFLKCCK